jgi:uncharacterized membrane protein YGL010W
MRKLDLLLEKYGESHQNSINKAFHWLCIPVILFSLFGILMSIPTPFEKSIFLNWGTFVLALALLYYVRLSISMFIGFLIIGGAVIYGNYAIYEMSFGDNLLLFLISIMLFVFAWIGQFIGHKIEGKKPSFLEDLQFLLIGPAWLLHFIYKKTGVPY